MKKEKATTLLIRAYVKHFLKQGVCVCVWEGRAAEISASDVSSARSRLGSEDL